MSATGKGPYHEAPRNTGRSVPMTNPHCNHSTFSRCANSTSEERMDEDSDGAMQTSQLRQLTLELAKAETREHSASLAREVKEEQVREAKQTLDVLCREALDCIFADKKAKKGKKRLFLKLFVDLQKAKTKLEDYRKAEALKKRAVSAFRKKPVRHVVIDDSGKK